MLCECANVRVCTHVANIVDLTIAKAEIEIHMQVVLDLCTIEKIEHPAYLA